MKALRSAIEWHQIPFLKNVGDDLEVKINVTTKKNTNKNNWCTTEAQVDDIKLIQIWSTLGAVEIKNNQNWKADQAQTKTILTPTKH